MYKKTLTGSKILLTGASGFFGSQTLSLLETTGIEVHALSRSLQPPASYKTVHWHQVDMLSDLEKLEHLIEGISPKHLIHCAWITEHGAYWQSRENLSWIAASLCLYRAFVKAGGTRFLALGSCMEYSPSDTEDCKEDLTEEDPWHLYGTSKLSLKRTLDKASKLDEVSFAWARIFMAYGPKEDTRRLVPQLISNLKNGKRTELSSGTQIRDFMDTRDAAEIILNVLSSPLEGAVNISTGSPSSIGSIATTLGHLFNRPDLIALGTLPDRPGEPARIVGDTTKLRQFVKVEKFDLEADLRRLVSEA